jgi:hypothetical protein
VVLEGGYNLLNVASGCAAIARVLLEPFVAGSKRSASETKASVQPGTESAIRETCRQHFRSWPCLAAHEGGSTSLGEHFTDETGCS